MPGASKQVRRFRVPSAPAGFHVRRTTPAGRHSLLRVFPGLDRLPAFAFLPARRAELARLARETEVEVVNAPFWMYIAPHEMPETMRRRGFQPVISRTDCLVVGAPHLRKSPRLVLCMDAIHELCHVLQRRAGHELWDEQYTYVDRPTEVEAYRVAVAIARSVGADDAFLRDYLKVEWITARDLGQLCRNVGVTPAPKASGRSGRSRPRAPRPARGTRRVRRGSRARSRDRGR